MLRFNRKIHKSVDDNSIIEVTQTDGIRSMHIGTATIQSSMNVNNPFALALTYTRGMMCFLLFSSSIKNVFTIGLGGGSVPKYIWQFCPTIQQTAVEVNAQVINIAHSHFHLPENDERLQVIINDGFAYLADHANSADCLMIDAFDAHGIPPDFCSQEFFDQCALSLTGQGIFVINLWGSDKNFDSYLQRIEQSFDNQVLMLPTGKPGNIVVFGFKQTPNLSLPHLRQRAKNLETSMLTQCDLVQTGLAHKIEFVNFFEKLCEHNRHNNNQFLMDTN